MRLPLTAARGVYRFLSGLARWPIGSVCQTPATLGQMAGFAVMMVLDTTLG